MLLWIFFFRPLPSLLQKYRAISSFETSCISQESIHRESEKNNCQNHEFQRPHILATSDEMQAHLGDQKVQGCSTKSTSGSVVSFLASWT